MNGWMRRRIERSRARCDKSATNTKTDKPQDATKQTSAQSAPASTQEASS
jgi:hypothetical protein